MQSIGMLVASVITLGGSAGGIAVAVYFIREGEITIRHGRHDYERIYRSLEPVKFWFWILFLLAFAALFMSAGIFALIRSLSGGQS